MESIRRSSRVEKRDRPRRAGVAFGAGGDVLVDAVDLEDRVTGAMARRDILAAGVNFRVVHVLLFNRDHELLLQRIAPGLRHAGSWGSSAAGFVQAGEAYQAAAVRKLATELGAGLAVSAVGKTSMVEGAATKFIGVFRATDDGPFSVDPASASEVEFLSLTAIQAHRRSYSRQFTATFLTVLDFYLRQVFVP